MLKPRYFNIRKATGKERVVRHAKRSNRDAFCASLHRYFVVLFREKIQTSLKLWIKKQIILPDYTLVSLFLPQTLESKHLWATKINIYSLRLLGVDNLLTSWSLSNIIRMLYSLFLKLFVLSSVSYIIFLNDALHF